MTTTRIRGLDTLQRKLRDLAGSLDRSKTNTSQAAAEPIAERARSLVKVLTGETRDTVQAVDGKVIAGGAAVFLERGTSKMSKRPFMGPAVEQSNTQAADAAKKCLDDVIDRVV